MARILGVQHLGGAFQLGGFRRGRSRTGDQKMHLAQTLHSGQGLGHRVGRQLRAIHIGKKKNGHQITPASSLSFAMSSSMEPTLTPALRPPGSSVLTTFSRALVSTP